MYMYISYIYRERVMYVFPSEFNPYQDHYDVVAVSTLLTVASNSGVDYISVGLFVYHDSQIFTYP